MTTHRAAPGTMNLPLTNFTGYDLFEDINTTIKDLYVKGRVANSLAWRIDVALTGFVRKVYSIMATEMRDTGIVSDSTEALLLLKEQAFAEENFSQIGSAASGVLTDFHQLLDIRSQAVELAENTAEDIDEFWKFKDTPLVQKLHDKQSTKANANEVGNIQKMIGAHKLFAQQMGQEIPENFDELMLKAEKARIEFKKSAQAEAGIARVPALEIIYDLMLNTRPETAEIIDSFDKLNLGLQEQLITSTAGSAEGAVKSAIEDRSGKLDTMLITMQSLVWKHRVATVLKAPKFKAYRAEAQAMAAQQEPTPAKAPQSPALAASLAQQAEKKKAESVTSEDTLTTAPPAPF